jgi:hypothetical protein
MGTSIAILLAIPVTIWICKGCHLMHQHATMIAGAGQMLYFVVDNM